MTDERPRMIVDIVADPVCPWCYIGLRAFQIAKEKLKDDFIVLPRIRPYQLSPDTPQEGVDRRAFYKKKFPDDASREQTVLQLKAAAAGAGFTFDPEKPEHLPNTLKAHQMIRLAHFDGAQERLALAIYEAFWDKGADLGDDDVLVALADEAGLDPENARSDLANPASIADVRAEAGAFRQAGVTGVPTFIVNERTGFSGALPPARLAEALKQAAAQAAPSNSV